ARRAVGLFSANHDILVYIDSDNFLPDSNWLLRMVEPFLDDEKVIATQTLRYTYLREDKMLNRYFALFGVADPIPYYFGKQDRISWIEDEWNLPGTMMDENENYYTIEFDPDKFLTLGCNGFLIKRKILLRAKCSPESFFHTDVLHDLALMGFNRYGIVKNSIVHATGNTFIRSLRKRFVYMTQHSLNMESDRRFKIYEPRSFSDNLKLVRYIIFTLTFVKPLYDSVRGFLRIRDLAWFIHLPMCWGVLIAYTLAVLNNGIKSLILKGKK
ncbi:hypothetical protein HKBW3S43_01705, partial [Candidatus Hakubella thermalkaliphila]